jgi:hypothetical protein
LKRKTQEIEIEIITGSTQVMNKEYSTVDLRIRLNSFEKFQCISIYQNKINIIALYDSNNSTESIEKIK